MMKTVVCQYLIVIFFMIYVDSIMGLPTRTTNSTSSREIGLPSNYVEIKLPVRIKTIDELIELIKNTMQSMASKIDITLASSNDPIIEEESLLVNDNKYKRVDKLSKSVKSSPVERKSYVNIDNPWLRNANVIVPPLINGDLFLPLILGSGGVRLPDTHFQKYKYIDDEKKLDVTTEINMMGTVTPKVSNNTQFHLNSLSDIEKVNVGANVTGKLTGQIPLAVPFEAFITISHESSMDDEPQPQPQPQQQQKPITAPETRYPLDYFPPYIEKNTTALSKESNINKVELPSKKKKNSTQRQAAIIDDILKMLGIIKKIKTKGRLQNAATISTATVSESLNKLRSGYAPQISFEDSHGKTTTNTSQRQEFDEDEDYEEEQGSLGSITELLPLAIPILEDLSSPESETDLVEVIQAAIPLLQGLSDPDEDGNDGVKDLIDTIVPVITKVIQGKNGEGSDIGAIAGPLFGLLAPLIGPIAAPIVGPLIRTISNPPTEGSSLASLITAITGPLSTPQEPSGMSPLSIVIAGATAALLKELHPGTQNGSDIGALVGAILSGVIAGTSSGLSGGSSASPHTQYGPYKVDLQMPIASDANSGFIRRPSPGPPLNSPFNFARPNRPIGTVNIGSTAKPSSSNHEFGNFAHVQQYTKPSSASYTHVQSQPTHDSVFYRQSQYHLRPDSQHQDYPRYPHGIVSAAATNDNGGSNYLPYGSTAVPAASVNPFSLITMSVKDILGAGIQVVSSVVNALFGIIGASSMEAPKPSYGPPTSGPYGHASG